MKGPDWKGAPDARGGMGCLGSTGSSGGSASAPGSAFTPARRATPRPCSPRSSTLRRHAQPGRQLWYWDPVDTVTAADERTLVFRLHHPYSRLPALLWGTHTAVYNEARRAADDDGLGADVRRRHRAVPARLVVAGARRRGGVGRLPGCARGFLRPGPERLAGIEWISILDDRERLAALERGEVDCLHGPPLDEVATASG